MIKTDNKVLACVDRSHVAETIADAAAWAAARLGAPLELLHILDRHPEIGAGDDHSGAIGIDAEAALLKALSEKDAVLSKKMREEGRLFLNALRDRAMAAGVPAPDTRQRYGHLEESLAEQEDGVRLFVLGRRGERAETASGDAKPRLGRNVERIVRALHKPILTVTENFQPPRRFMIAFDGGSVTRRGVEMLASSPLLQGIPCHILMSGKPSSEASGQLAWAKERLESAGYAVSSQNTPGAAEAVIAATVEAQGIDLLVMGAFNHSFLRRLILGSRTAELLAASRIPTLLLR
jgi:nucleotide-binding universal stress UspA family protein